MLLRLGLLNFDKPVVLMRKVSDGCFFFFNCELRIKPGEDANPEILVYTDNGKYDSN